MPRKSRQSPSRPDAIQSQKFFLSLTAALAMCAMAVLATGARASAQETILHNFTGGKDGKRPFAALIADGSGNLYGTTPGGGTYGDGTAFELMLSGGVWQETVLYSFHGDGGREPFGSLIFDPSGNLYGTTFAGGFYDKGTVFNLTPQAGGTWKETVLHSFNSNAKDGTGSFGGLVFDTAGNLYGLTSAGGVRNSGTVFELTPSISGHWTEEVLYSFGHGNKQDGRFPQSSLIIDALGNLYGTTLSGGGGNCHLGCGTVFELSPQNSGGWQETILHAFSDNGSDGTLPYGSLVFGPSGNLYGTTSRGGIREHGGTGCHLSGCGTVFELTPQAGGRWSETLPYSFPNSALNGAAPFGGLIRDMAGNLYSTTAGGGPKNGGTVFELTPTGGGGWTYSLLYGFNYLGTDGSSPYAGVIIDSSGNLFGTTFFGGTRLGTCDGFGCGTVFEITP